MLHLGCQWKRLPIDKDGEGLPEIHYTRIYRIWRRWVGDGCMERDLRRLGVEASPRQPPRHGGYPRDGTTTAARKGGDNLDFSGHKRLKGDKVVAFRDRHCNVIAPFVTAPGNRNESPLRREALPEAMRVSRGGGHGSSGHHRQPR